MIRKAAKLLLVVTLSLLPLFAFVAEATQVNPRRIEALTKPIFVIPTTPSSTCLNCHGVSGFAVPIGMHGDSRKRHLYINNSALMESVHKEQTCVNCHTGIRQIPHLSSASKYTVNCIQCHKRLLKALIKEPSRSAGTQKVSLMQQHLATAVQHATDYLSSIHAKKNKKQASKSNATCWDCHGKHHITTLSYRQHTPLVCAHCHQKEFKGYQGSVHGVSVLLYSNTKAAICSDCHTAHKITSPKEDPAIKIIMKNCGKCHNAQLKTYKETYHGQVETLGYTMIAKCYDCHGSHNILVVGNPRSKVHPANRLNTCRKCHKGAGAGFVTFEPHGDSSNFKRYPEIWITAKLMNLLLIGVFLFFWTHSALWFYREYKERKIQKINPCKRDGVKTASPLHIRRFSWQWRLTHLILAIAVMGLAITGTTLLYADSLWAHVVIRLIGGPENERIIHRVCATVFGTLFLGHIFVMLYQLVIRDRKTFRWFGPTSLLPRWQDVLDCISMFKWFFGKGSRPVFDRWAYWEKFDYWAPFWGMFVIGSSGLVLCFHDLASKIFPGWIFNVATILHSEEAFLAIVFLFSVHFFNCHFRPDKFPQDVVMFTGSLPLDEFKKEHALEYKRLVENNTLEKYIVRPPSLLMVRLSKLLGFVLIVIGLLLLTFVITGFMGIG